MTEHIPQQQLHEYAEAFELYDTDSTGAVPLKSVHLVLSSLGVRIPEASLVRLKEKKLNDGEDEVNFSDFLTLVCHGSTEDELFEDDVDERRRQLWAALSLFDHKRDGYIATSDFRKSMGSILAESEIEAVLREGDVENSGKIKYEVFLDKWFAEKF